jgi:transcriptional regulator with XRE-family HTH domain
MDNNTNIEVGLRLKVARKTAGFKTALDFANQMKIPKSTYSQHENGKRSLTAEQIIYYADKLDIAASWLLTGQGHPCSLSSNMNQRKEKIEIEVIQYQLLNKLPQLKNAYVEINNNAAVVNMELFSEIITSAITALTSKNLPILSKELVSFCIDIYNNIEFLEVSHKEKIKIIDLSINSMLRGNYIIQKRVINS